MTNREITREIEQVEHDCQTGLIPRKAADAEIERLESLYDPNRDRNGNWIGSVQHENGWTP